LARPQSVRYLNEIRALNVLFREGGMSRADLARALGLNRSSIGNIINDLLADRFVVERRGQDRAPGEARTGRPGILVEIDPAGAIFLGAEIAVDRLTAFAIDLQANEIGRLSIPFATPDHSPETGVARTAALVSDLLSGLPDIGQVQGLCVTIPALLSHEGVALNALNLNWRNVPVTRLLRRHFSNDMPILTENDANAFAIAETYRGTSRRSEAVAFLLINNGAGGGIVIRGKVFRGGDGFAGEFGQLPIVEAGATTGRLKPGHLESYIGKDAILAQYRCNGGAPGTSLDDFLAALGLGESGAALTASQWGTQLAKGLVQITNVLNPGLVILGGMVAPVFPHVTALVEDLMRKDLLDGYPMPKIEVSTLGPEGSALGGAMLLHQKMFSIDEGLVHARTEPLRIVAARNPARRPGDLALAAQDKI
jgi:predicted NBD/HSP70 family sugar kinase